MMMNQPASITPSNLTQAQVAFVTNITIGVVATAPIALETAPAEVAAEIPEAATTTLFRAVGSAEADSINATGAFTPSTSTGSDFKGFFFNESDATSFGNRMTTMTGDTHTVVSGQAPTDLVTSSPPHNAATEGPGVLIPNNKLPLVTPNQ
jgi:hypothetical protein